MTKKARLKKKKVSNARDKKMKRKRRLEELKAVKVIWLISTL